MHIAEKNCPQLTMQTANAIDDASLHEVFISTQRNNLYLCIKAALQWDLPKIFQHSTLTHSRYTLNSSIQLTFIDVVFIVASRFPHYWV